MITQQPYSKKRCGSRSVLDFATKWLKTIAQEPVGFCREAAIHHSPGLQAWENGPTEARPERATDWIHFSPKWIVHERRYDDVSGDGEVRLVTRIYDDVRPDWRYRR